jgi:hypothetical protein
MLYGNTDKMSKELLGTLIVDELMPFSAKMKLLHGSGLILSPPIPDFLALQTPPLPAFWALQTKAGTLPNFFVYIPPEDPFHSLYRESDLEPQHILLVDKPKFAHLKIRTSLPANLLVIEVTDKRVTKYGVNVIADQVKPDPDNVSCILERAAHYRRELYRTNRQRVIAANGNISVGFFQLHSPEVRRFGRTTEEVTPIGPNLCDNNQIIDFVVEEDKPYGICLKNNTVEDLYVNAFFFDNTNFAIGKSHWQL